MLKRLRLLAIILLTFSTQSAIAQCCCATNLGAINPNMNWQYFQHSCLGYVSFPAQAGCTYIFTYCNSQGPSAYYSGDPYLTINSSAMSGGLIANDDWCGLGSYIQWTAPATQTYFLQMGNWAQGASCACGVSRNLAYRSTNCAGGVQPPTSITASSASLCAGQSTTLTANGTMGTQNWYTGSCGGTFIGSGASITVNPVATTTYYVNNNSNGQASPSCASITITVNPSPAAPVVSGNLVLCGSGSTVLTASGGLNTYNWYSNAAGSVLVGTGASFTTPVLNATTTYYVNTQQGGNVGVGSQTFNFTGSAQTFTAPVTGTYTFDVYGARGGNVTSYYPTNGGLGGRAQGSMTLTAGQVINVYVGGQGQDRLGNHPYGNCAFVPGGWNGGGNNRSAGNGTPGGGGSDIRVGGNALANRVIVAGGGGGCGWSYAAGGHGGGLTGNNGTNSPNSGGTQVSGGAIANNGGPCGVTAGSLGQGGDGSGWSAGGGGGGGGYYGGGGGGYNNGGGGGSSWVGGVNGGTTTTGVQNGNGQIIISWNAQGCPSALTPVTVTINPQPVVTASGSTICAGQTATLTATSTVPGGTFTWSPGNLVGSSVSVTPNATTQYTVSYSAAGCPPVTATATVTVNALPAAPTANNVTLCGPGSATLTATGGQNNNYIWYANANGTGQLGTNASYTTPNLQSTTTYYVQTATAQGGAQNFPFTGGVQNFTAPINGVYTIEAWGAKGGDDGNIGANGGYATGTVALTAGQTLTVYTGGMGSTCVAGGGGGWNGGGNAGPAGCSGGGGGASDVRLGGNGLANRIIVAGGGGGAGCCGQQAGAGGGLNGNNGSGGGGTQGAGGGGNNPGSLGQGGHKNNDGGGGGGGYYGGGAAFNDDGGGGGSSYLGGVLGGNTIAGNASMPNPNGGNMTGNAGNGYVRITWSGISCASALTPVTVTVNPVPVITVNNATVCAGQPATLTANSTVPGGTFTWSPGGQNGNTITVTPNVTTTYTATYNVAGCPPVTGTGTVTVNPLQPITGTLSACLGLTSQLANVVTPGSWSSSNPAVATISAGGLVTGVSAGNTTITYNASNGCSTTSQFTVYPQPVLTATPSNVLCFGGTGSVNLSASGANAPYTYGGSPTQNLNPGTYTYTATSVDGCVSAPVSVTITQPQAALALTTTQVNVLCSGNNTGSIDLTVTGGTAPYTYAWSNNTTAQDPQNIPAGSYTVTVTDANGCTATTTVTITQPQAPLALTTTQVNVGCFGNSSGSVNLTVSGGTSPYTYLWNTGGTVEDPTNMPAGNYNVTVTDANGCTATTNVTITQPQAPLSLSTTQVNILCFGNSTGSVNLTVAGGTAAYTYLWNTGGTVEDPSGMPAGSYNVIVTDANGCVDTTSVILTQPQAGLALSTTQVNVLCSGNNTGSIDLTVTGGVAPYTYAWSNNTTAQDPQNLAAGPYTVTVTDANGCTATTTVTITQPSGLTSSYTQVNVGCFGNSTGSIDLTVTGGVAPYTFAWSNNTTQEDLQNIPAGVYTVVATDANGCTTTQTVTITQPQAALSLSSTQVNVLCFGNSTGSINLTVAGGTAPYTYAWSNNTTQEDPQNLAAGSYTVTVTDANGCTAQLTDTITQPQAGLALSTTQVNVLCFGNNTGSINLTVTGGTAPYTYAWSNNTTAQDPQNLTAGSYTVTVTDANGCTSTATATISEPPALASSFTQVNVLCFGNATGSIDLTVTGGVAPYTYAWSNNTTQEDLQNIPAGVYTVIATDANGCTTTQTVTITQPQAALSLSSTQVNVLCFGNSTGSINLTVAGGIAPYTYAWSNNTTQEDPQNLPAGAYTVTVTDANGCTAQLTDTITQPQAGLALSTTQVNVLCFGNNTGSINLTVTGGTAPYTYAWSNNTTAQDPQNLTAGSYTVTVTDANGCTSTATVTITEPATAVTASATAQNILCLNGTGGVSSTPGGGVPPYTFSWTNNATTQNITGLQAGTYTVTVMDANGCTANATATVATTLSQVPVQILNLTGTTILTCTNPSITLQATGGVTYNWTGGATPQNDTNAISIPGTYTVNMIDPNGCPVSQTITLTQNIALPPAAITNITGTTIIDCNAPSIDLQATGGGTYQWNNNLGTSANVNITQAGTYTVVVTAANGCQDSSTVSITVAPVPAVTGNDTTICSGQSVTISPVYYPNGGQMVWTSGQTTPSITVSPNNTTMYSVLYTWNGCTATADVTITVIPTPTLTVTSSNICFGDTAQITATPNLPNGTFDWITTNETTQSISVNPQTTTTYDVEYTLNGCTSAMVTSTVTVTPLPIITVADITICEGATGTLTASSNVPGGTYTWNQGGNTSSITVGPQSTTTYGVSYTVNGCTSNTENPTVTVNPLPAVSFTLDTTSGCVPVTVGLSADTTGQQATYAWTSNGASGTVGANGQMIFAVGGCYDVTLTATMNGCANSVTQSNVVCVQDYPIANFDANPSTFTEPTQTVNFNNTTVGATGYVWNFGDGNLSNEEFPEHMFQGTNEGFTITLIASTSMGCMDSTSLTIEANLGAVYYVPNTFTPDGDKFNQVFKPVFSTGVSAEGYEMVIYNRWGEVMFESHNINVGWDGSYGSEGLDCPSGTYTYKITFVSIGATFEKKILTGHVNLLR